MMQSVENNNENEHIVSMPNTNKIEIDEDYDFIPSSIIFKIVSRLLYSIACPILYIYAKIFCGLKINGLENLRKTKGAKITVSNHVHFLDCAFVSISNFPSPIYFPTIESNFGIPIINVIIKLLNALPIPTKIESKKKFRESIDKLLKDEKTIHFYPEASLWPYYDKIRNFKNGAFIFATNNNVPIIPMVYTYRKPSNLMKYIKIKPYITLNILEPVYPNDNYINLRDTVKKNIENIIYK